MTLSGKAGSQWLRGWEAMAGWDLQAQPDGKAQTKACVGSGGGLGDKEASSREQGGAHLDADIAGPQWL